jgi:hypothetical protein
MDLQQLNTRIQTSIDNVINGGSSEYIKFTSDDDTIWTFRVSNHIANPIRTDDNTISLVIELPSVDEDFGSWGVRKKQFRNINNQYFLNEDGCFTENFCDIEEFTSYIID